MRSHFAKRIGYDGGKMNTSIELHDTVVANITTLEGAAIVNFQPAYLHKSEGRPGFDAGSGWLQSARLIIADAAISGDIPDLPCDVLGGDLVIGRDKHENLIPVPLESTKPTRLDLNFDAAHMVVVAGSGIRLELLGEPEYVEDFSP